MFFDFYTSQPYYLFQTANHKHLANAYKEEANRYTLFDGQGKHLRDLSTQEVTSITVLHQIGDQLVECYTLEVDRD